MKNLLNCHSIGLHSFPVSLENGLYKRIFYAEDVHVLWKPLEIAIHPHHVDIKITVLKGELINIIYDYHPSGERFKRFKWNSHILNGKGGFEYLGQDSLKMVSDYHYRVGGSVQMKACEMHTVQIEKGSKCIWLIEESIPSCEFDTIAFSKHDLTAWTADGLYVEVDDEIKRKYIGKYL